MSAHGKDDLEKIFHQVWEGPPAPVGRAGAVRAGPALEALVNQGRTAFPEVALTGEAFVRHLAGRAAAIDRLAGLHGADLYLACACAAGEPRAIAALVERLRLEVPRALHRISRAAELHDEVRQILQVDLLVGKAIAGYRGEAKLSSWIRASAVRVALKLRAREGREPLEESPAGIAPELEFIKGRYQADFERCFAEELAALPPRSRTLLRLHYVEGLGIDQLAGIYHVGRSTAARWIAREREGLVEGLRKRLTAQLGIARAELDSLMRLVVSRLHVSLDRALE